MAMTHKEYDKRYRERHKNDPEYKAKRKAHHQKWLEKNREKWNAYVLARRKAKKMKDKLIKTIREVSIADKDYPEYIEAIADKLIAEGYIICVEDANELHS